MKRLLIGTAALLGGAVGCMDGPLYQLKRANPFFQAEWNKDRDIGPTYDDRLQELELLEAQLPTMEPRDQEGWALRLNQLIAKEPSAEIRIRAIKLVANLSSPAAVEALNTASVDEVEKVRLVACKAWGNRGGTEARDMLMSIATRDDETTSVRQAAIDSLSAFQDPEVNQLMATLLDDRSPAIQYQVVDSLKAITGQDYGGDFESWKLALAGEQVPEPEVTQTAWGWIPGLK